MRKVLTASLLALSLLVAGASTAEAHHHKPHRLQGVRHHWRETNVAARYTMARGEFPCRTEHAGGNKYMAYPAEGVKLLSLGETMRVCVNHWNGHIIRHLSYCTPTEGVVSWAHWSFVEWTETIEHIFRNRAYCRSTGVFVWGLHVGPIGWDFHCTVYAWQSMRDDGLYDHDFHEVSC